MDMTLQSLLTKFLLMPLKVPVEGLGLRAAGSQQER